jgi:hypothetical protein
MMMTAAVDTTTITTIMTAAADMTTITTIMTAAVDMTTTIITTKEDSYVYL